MPILYLYGDLSVAEDTVTATIADDTDILSADIYPDKALEKI